VKSPDFEVAFSELSEVSGLPDHIAQMLWSGTAGTVNQFGRFRVSFPLDNGEGFIFRSTPNNGDAGPHYEVHVTGASVRWEYVLDDVIQNLVGSCTLPGGPVGQFDWFGATITGTGSNTVVEVFFSATELDSDPNNWPSSVCSLTDDPATAVDTGDRVGVRSFTNSNTQDSFMDDVCVGGVPI
jgi:hypothetical protein